jgi:hypothetical protein
MGAMDCRVGLAAFLAMTGLVVYGWLNSDFGFLP